MQPFLERIEAHLPPERYRLIPMYSMSTETVETISHFERGTIAFLPLAPRVLYEFVEEGFADPQRNLRTPDQLKAMQSYSMVVSDAFGLRRYQTEDVFLCNGSVRGLPDLRFLRRRNLEYSFTGEKVSSEQINLVLQKLREEDETIGLHGFLTCIPSHPGGEPFPHYKLVLVGGTVHGGLADRCDVLLQQVNAEYKNKREDGRLGAMRFVSLSFADFIRVAPEGQFKFLPLYRRTWEEMMGTEPHALSNT